MHAPLTAALAALYSLFALACSGESDNGLCTTYGPDNSGYEGCANPLFDLARHPCELEVERQCGVGGSATCSASVMRNCATDYYLRHYDATQLPDCDPSQPVLAIEAALEISLYRYSNIEDASVARHSNGLQHYYAPYALTMNTGSIAAADRTRFAIAGTEDEIEQALVEAGIPRDATSLSPEQEAVADRAIGNVMFAPTKAFFQRHSLPAEAKVNVVVVDQIISPSMASLMDIGGTVVGLGLSSALIARLDQEEPNSTSINAMLQIDGDFTPTLFVGHSDIVKLAGNFDLVVAHEMGHALGLPHVELEGNLMQQGGSQTCRRWLSQVQIDLMGPFSEVSPSEADAISAILASKRRVLEKLLLKRRSGS